jgi:hypothetical protein
MSTCCSLHLQNISGGDKVACSKKTLETFEQALQDMGAQMHRLRVMPPSEERSKIVDEQFGILKKILSPIASENMSGEIGGKTVIQKLRELLGISQLTALRGYYLTEASKRLKA